MARPASSKGRNGGLPVDASGGPAVDPTENVLALTAAEARRQDDLRDAQERLQDAKITSVEKQMELRAITATLSADHARELSEKESSRLDAIRQVDVLAVNTTAAQSLQAIQALAATTQTNADNVRKDLASTAATIATQTAATVAAITERISALEKSSYEGKGKQAVSDPMMVELVSEMKSMRESRANVSGHSEAKAAVSGPVWAAVGAIAAGLIVAAVLSLARPSPVVPVLPVQPSITQPSR